jgi:ArsR family transcriptional regulator
MASRFTEAIESWKRAMIERFGTSGVSMTDQECRKIARALADETRYRILKEIPADGEKCCTDLSECFGITKATVTHHINKLCELGLVEGRKEQTYHYLTRNQEKLNEYIDSLKREFV